MTNMDMDVATLLRQPATLIAGAVVGLVLVVWLGVKVRKVARSERPDDALANVAMVIGLGWSSEAVWEITTRAGFPLGVRLLLFFVLETFLAVSMLRAKRHMAEHGWPGRPGQTAWGVAAAMGIVAMAMSTTLAEAFLRLIIPLGLAKLWWDGLVGGRKRPEGDASSWRWTPRRILLAIGAIEPGHADVAKVQRDYLTNQMTKIYFSIGQGSEKARRKRTAKLAKLSLDADVAIIAEVQHRVGQAVWFLGEQERQAFLGFEPVPTPAKVVMLGDVHQGKTGGWEIVNYDDHATPDPWAEHSTPVANDPDAALANWAAMADGQAEAEMAKSTVATATRKPLTDGQKEAAKAIIRYRLNAISPSWNKAQVDACKASIDSDIESRFHVSNRTARRLRSAVTGEPVSAAPANDREGIHA